MGPPGKVPNGTHFGSFIFTEAGFLPVVTSSSNDNTLSVFHPPAAALLGYGSRFGLSLLRTLGDAASPPPMQFRFHDGERSGWMAMMAFTGTGRAGGASCPGDPSDLLVTDAGNDAVHVISVGDGVHVGYVAAPGMLPGPRGVAATRRGPLGLGLAAVSAWKWHDSGDHVVWLFEGSGACWTAVRVLAGGFGGPGSADGQLQRPFGLRFSRSGAGLAVADFNNSA